MKKNFFDGKKNFWILVAIWIFTLICLGFFRYWLFLIEYSMNSRFESILWNEMTYSWGQRFSAMISEMEWVPSKNVKVDVKISTEDFKSDLISYQIEKLSSSGSVTTVYWKVEWRRGLKNLFEKYTDISCLKRKLGLNQPDSELTRLHELFECKIDGKSEFSIAGRTFKNFK